MGLETRVVEETSADQESAFRLGVGVGKSEAFLPSLGFQTGLALFGFYGTFDDPLFAIAFAEPNTGLSTTSKKLGLENVCKCGGW